MPENFRKWRRTLLKNIPLVDKNVGKLKNMGRQAGKNGGQPEKEDSYSLGNTVIPCKVSCIVYYKFSPETCLCN